MYNYSRMYNNTKLSAQIILKYLFNNYKINSIIDVGCGIGVWLLIAQKEFNINNITGIDGDWVKKEELLINEDNFLRLDLSQDLNKINGKYDLAISLEVAEHLPYKISEEFVNKLISLSNLVLFSAATPGQKGTNHINEQPHYFWIDLFKKYNYECYDFIRPIIKGNENIPIWYKNNIFIFKEI